MDNNNEGEEMKTWMAEIADRIIQFLSPIEYRQWGHLAVLKTKEEK